jgi:hypothetical protein
MCALEARRAMGETGRVSWPSAKTSFPGLRRALGQLTFVGMASCSHPLALDPPAVAPSQARDPTPVDLEPIAAGSGVVGDFAPPGPAAVLTAAMKSELAGRALRGGETGGYAARCTLDRFAVRLHTRVTDSEEILAIYADLSCEARRARDGAVVWRGELRGRSVASSPNVLGSDASTSLRLADRALSDAAREMASDLAIRALGLRADPSARVFTDEAQQRGTAGLDDTPYGPAALQENGGAVEGAMRAMNEHEATLRAAAWNVVAMAAGPGDPWLAGDKLRLDENALVRFVQYKALARLASPSAIAQLRAATPQEEEELLAELLRDATAIGGIGLARTRR